MNSVVTASYGDQIRVILNSEDIPSENILVDMIRRASDDYYNDGESEITDAEFDALYLLLRTAYPSSKQLTVIGSDVRGSKIKLPHILGSMDQVYTGQAAKWIKDNGWQDELFVLGNKEDGYSCLAVYGRNGQLQIAYSRGNGYEGADVTRHARRIKAFPQTMDTQCAIRLEVIIDKQVFFDQLRNHPDTMLKSNKLPYQTPRNYVSGKMNSSLASDWFYDNVRVIATSVIEPKLGKRAQYEFLQNNGWQVPPYCVVKGSDINDEMLTEYLNRERDKSSTEIDGIVLDLDDPTLRAALRRKSSSINPMYSKKFKVGSEDNIAFPTVVKVHYEPSKDGYCKPRIEIEPVQLQGVTITYCTGFNAKYIRDHKVGPGAVIQMTRKGDVIPYCQKVLQPAAFAQLPSEEEFGKLEWTEGEVDLRLVDAKNNRNVQINILIDVFTKLEIPFLKEGSIIKLYDSGFTTAASIIKAELATLQQIVGESAGEKIFNGLKQKLNPITFSNLAGSSNTLGRGIGRRRVEKLIEVIPNIDDWNQSSIASVEGFDQITADIIVSNIQNLKAFLSEIEGFYTLKDPAKKISDGSLSGKAFVFTGFRDKEAENKIISLGGVISNAPNKNTFCVVADDISGSSGKLTKARSLIASGININIFTIEQFRDYLAKF